MGLWDGGDAAVKVKRISDDSHGGIWRCKTHIMTTIGSFCLSNIVFTRCQLGVFVLMALLMWRMISAKFLRKPLLVLLSHPNLSVLKIMFKSG